MNFHIKVLVWFLVLLGKIPRSEIAGSYEKYIFLLYKKFPNCSLKWLCNFALLSAVCESSVCSKSSPVFGIISLLNFNHSIRSVGISYFSFDLCFPDNLQCWASFHVLN